ncbi:MAG: hypothetical protein GWN67_17620 [Phycisphaerae bacterium]|nr:hypothetical protein [Phycisphaerae bacterium]NIP52921.1 hypothetical protein [Phycisphaerae bacterium]NIS51972.1 hypothetical protein [Phycisphaerae bacterium]NIU09486.1 hypothetical protein [Phycisphaerae bacterium]NIU58137.1 hypothetical protein [Phycisphaerae bacterium]
MKTIEISDELSARLKAYVVDPFDDTPEKVIGRVLDIADKAKSMWTSWEEEEAKKQKEPEHRPQPQKRSRSGQEQVGIAL